MKTADVLPRMYEDLANHFARQGESRQRDQCLVLAADVALSNGLPEEAERLRKRLLLTNPHHLLRPYTTMAEAMQSSDVRDLVDDLHKQWPPETVAKLLNRLPSSKSEPLAPQARSERQTSRVKAETFPAEPTGTATSPLVVLMFAIGLLIGVGLLFLALGGSMLE